MKLLGGCVVSMNETGLSPKDMEFLYTLAAIVSDRVDYYMATHETELDSDEVCLAVDLVQSYFLTMKSKERFKKMII